MTVMRGNEATRQDQRVDSLRVTSKQIAWTQTGTGHAAPLP